MNTVERKKIVKLIQPNVLPNSIRIAVSVKDDVELDSESAVAEEENEMTTFDFSGYNKLQLVELLEETVQNDDVVSIKAKVSAIKVEFLKLNKEDIDRERDEFIANGGNQLEYQHNDDPLEVRFKAAFNIFKKNKAKYNDELERQKLDNLETKKQILEDLKVLIASEETLKKTYDEFRALQEKWNTSGQVPATEATNMWSNYHFYVEQFYNKVKINRELRDLDLKKNLEAKIQLCEKMEELLLAPAGLKTFKLMQQYHDDWKEIGPVQQDKKDEIWDRFKAASDKINAIRREHYAKIEEEQNANYEAKRALCEKMEELVENTVETLSEWTKKSDEVNELFNTWKSIGPAVKKLNDEIWTRFKGSMDSFFEKKKEFLGGLKDQQTENYNRKMELCIEAEALAASEEWKKATDKIKKLQEDWKAIGPAPKRYSEKIWKRFRAACDTFFKNKSEHFSGIKGQESENLKLKQAIIERVKAFELKAERAENMEAIKAFQREWMSIGHVPMKVKDAVQDEFRKLVDGLFDKMRIAKNEISTEEFRDMVQTMKEAPDARDKVRKERINLQGRIDKLVAEINTLENNIGYFSKSKQAGLLVAEYEKKINNLKNDLKVLEAKMKMLRD